MSNSFSATLAGFKQSLHARQARIKSLSFSDVGCVLYVPGNRISAGLVPDLSGKGNNGINHGAILKDIGETFPMKWKNKIIDVSGKALSFDGVDDYVDCGNDESLNITDAITIEAWVKPASLAGYGYIVRKGSNAVYVLRVNAGGTIRSWIYHGGTEYSAISSQNIGVGNWAHLVGLYGDSDHKPKLFINGTEVSYTTQDTVPSDYTIDTSSEHLFINYTPFPFNGTIDEVRIYNRALSAAEIKRHYDIMKPMFQ